VLLSRCTMNWVKFSRRADLFKNWASATRKSKTPALHSYNAMHPGGSRWEQTMRFLLVCSVRNDPVSPRVGLAQSPKLMWARSEPEEIAALTL